MLKAGSLGPWAALSNERGDSARRGSLTLLSNILLTPFDREMRRKGYQLTRWPMTGDYFNRQRKRGRQ